MTTGTTPANPWTTASTQSGDLDYATTYYAQATQTGQTSAVFIFSTPVQTAPTAIALASGSGQVSSGDTATITFSGQLNATSLCSTWTNNGTTQTLTNATITFANGTQQRHVHRDVGQLHNRTSAP